MSTHFISITYRLELAVTTSVDSQQSIELHQENHRFTMTATPVWGMRSFEDISIGAGRLCSLRHYGCPQIFPLSIYGVMLFRGSLNFFLWRVPFEVPLHYYHEGFVRVGRLHKGVRPKRLFVVV